MLGRRSRCFGHRLWLRYLVSWRGGRLWRRGGLWLGGRLCRRRFRAGGLGSLLARAGRFSRRWLVGFCGGVGWLVRLRVRRLWLGRDARWRRQRNTDILFRRLPREMGGESRWRVRQRLAGDRLAVELEMDLVVTGLGQVVDRRRPDVFSFDEGQVHLTGPPSALNGHGHAGGVDAQPRLFRLDGHLIGRLVGHARCVHDNPNRWSQCNRPGEFPGECLAIGDQPDGVIARLRQFADLIPVNAIGWRFVTREHLGTRPAVLGCQRQADRDH